jgi:amidase
LSALGPLSNTLAGIKAFMKIVIESQPWLKDPLAMRKRWSDDEYGLVDHGQGKELCFAILWDDGLVVPHPPIIRGLEMTKKALLEAGHHVIDWKPFKHDEIYTVSNAIWQAGAKEDFTVVTAPTGEPVIASMGLDQEVPTGFDLANAALSAYQLWQMHKKKRDLREEYLQHWNDTIKVTGTGRAVDAIISPVAPYTAIGHGKNK